LKSGNIARMGKAASDARALLREDMSNEYYAILGVVSSYDGWLLIVKGWSVTLSLAALGLGSSSATSRCSLLLRSPGPRFGTWTA
jgi:hypothetical protein